MATNTHACPCGANGTYAEHCERIHLRGAGLGVSAESLMRARYSAYVLQNREFLLESWHPDTRPTMLSFDPGVEWLELEIVTTEAGTGLDATGTVEYRARLLRKGEPFEIHERSSFERLDGRWVYIDGS